MARCFTIVRRHVCTSAGQQTRQAAIVGLTVISALLLATAPARAQAAARVVGPIDPRIGFPSALIDENGVSLAPGYDDIILCLAGPTLPNLALPPAVPGNFADEVFYSLADGTLNVPGATKVVYRAGLEMSFVNAPLVEAGQQTLFGRVRFRVIGGGVTPGTW